MPGTSLIGPPSTQSITNAGKLSYQKDAAIAQANHVAGAYPASVLATLHATATAVLR